MRRTSGDSWAAEVVEPLAVIPTTFSQMQGVSDSATSRVTIRVFTIANLDTEVRVASTTHEAVIADKVSATFATFDSELNITTHDNELAQK